MTLYYDVVFFASLAATILYMLLWQKRFNIQITLVFALVPFANMGFAMLAHATDLETALMANRMSYVCGCYLPLMVQLVVCNLCDVRIPRWGRLLMLIASTGTYLTALTMGQSPLFYKSVEFVPDREGIPLVKEYGPMHTVFTLLVVFYFLFGIGVIVYSFFRKKQVSRKVLVLLLLPEVIALLSFYAGRQLFPQIELLPAAYLLAQLFYFALSRQIALYDIAGTATDTLIHAGQTGVVTFDFKLHYLGSNPKAREILPELEEMTVDHSNRKKPLMQDRLLGWLTAFQQDPSDETRNYFDIGDRIYLATVGYLFGGKKKRGYEMKITDETKEQQRVRLMNNFNIELQRQVEMKTEHIREMHDNLILSMAMMVESRDNSTGGHIRRTSDGIRILIDAIHRDGTMALEPEFCRNLIKAAPMHDLGKIAVDDEVLRKPGRFTPEEFEKMKAHAAEGARIVHEILKDTDDEDFHHIAENVAHYHHERWDGSGYPEKLKGEEIPREARIMAIADVYDALVSKRVYKDRMSFEKAHSIIMEGMGTQFDPSLEKIFLLAEPELQAYYSKTEETEGKREVQLCGR